MKDDNPFWRFAVKTYCSEGVSEILLQVQDQFSVDVNMILYSAWLASENRSLTSKHASEVENSIELWRNEVIAPIRNLRVSLRSIVGAELIRDDIKKIEIHAEKEQIKIMYSSFLTTSSADPDKSKVELLDNNLRSLSAIGFEEESTLVLVKKLLVEKMGWHIN